MLFGFIFGFLRGALIAVLILSVIAQFAGKSVRNEMRDNSYIGKWVCDRIAPMASEYVNREKLGEQMDALRDRVDLPTPAELIE